MRPNSDTRARVHRKVILMQFIVDEKSVQCSVYKCAAAASASLSCVPKWTRNAESFSSGDDDDATQNVLYGTQTKRYARAEFLVVVGVVMVGSIRRKV